MGALRHALGRTLRRSALAAALATALSSSVVAAQPDAVYEPADFSTLYQDHACETPVTALEQTVAFMLDKAQGLVRGAEIVSNGDFSNGLTGWTAIGTGGTAQIVSGEMELTGSGGAFPGRRQVLTTVVGTCYEISVTARRGTTAQTVAASFGATQLSFTTTSNVTKTMKVYATATSTNLDLTISNAAATGTAYFDNISVKPLPGLHVGMTTAGARPTVSARLNLLECSDLHSGIVVGTIGSGGAFPTGLTQSSIAGITRQVLGFGTLSDGRKYFDLRVSSTNTSGSTGFMDLYFTDGNPLLAAAVNNQFTAGLTVHYTAGSTTTGFSNANRNMFVAEFNGGTFLTSSTIATASATGTPTRFTVSRTFNNASVTNARMALDLTVTTGGTIDLTIRVIEPQLEYGTVANRFQRVTTNTDYDSAGFPVYLRFDGVDDGIFTPYLPAGTAFPFTLMAAARSTGVTLGGVFGLWGGAPPYYEIQKHTTLNQWRAFDRGAVNYINAETPAQGSTHVLRMDMTATTVNLIVDDTDAAAATTQDNVVGTLTDIRIGNGGSGFFAGQFFGGLIFFGTRTDAQFAIGKQWLRAKSTIT